MNEVIPCNKEETGSYLRSKEKKEREMSPEGGECCTDRRDQPYSSKPISPWGKESRDIRERPCFGQSRE